MSTTTRPRKQYAPSKFGEAKRRIEELRVERETTSRQAKSFFTRMFSWLSGTERPPISSTVRALL